MFARLHAKPNVWYRQSDPSIHPLIHPFSITAQRLKWGLQPVADTLWLQVVQDGGKEVAFCCFFAGWTWMRQLIAHSVLIWQLTEHAQLWAVSGKVEHHRRTRTRVSQNLTLPGFEECSNEVGSWFAGCLHVFGRAGYHTSMKHQLK